MTDIDKITEITEDMTEEQFKALSKDIVGAIQHIEDALKKHGFTNGASINFGNTFWSFNPFESNWQLSRLNDNKPKMSFDFTKYLELE